MAQIKRENPAYEKLLDFYEKVYMEKERCYQTIRPRFLKLDEQLIKIKAQEGFPLLDKSTIELDLTALEEFFQNILQASRERNPDTGAKLVSYIQQGNKDVREMIQEMWEGKLKIKNGKEEEIGDPTLLSFLLVETLKPVYEYCANILQEFIPQELWKQGYCPVCGEHPPIAEISGEKGTRLLFCIYCGTDWPFPLLKCPFCNNEEEEEVKSFYPENEKRYRIEVCKICGKYLKVIDTQAIGCRVPLDVENIATLHLDILAQKGGYRRGASFPLLI